MLLDRIDELPLRRHEIRGNPAGLLARLLRADRRAQGARGSSPTRSRPGPRSASARPRARAPSARRRAASSSSPSSTPRHDAILRDAGSLDAGDLVLELGGLLAERADVRAASSRRDSATIVADELEDAGPPAARPARRSGVGSRQPRLSPATTIRRSAASAARSGGLASRAHPEPRSSRSTRSFGAGPDLAEPPRAVVAAMPGPAREADGLGRGRGGGALLALHARARAGPGRRPRDRASARRRAWPRGDLRRRRLGPARGRASSPRRWRSAASRSGSPGRRRLLPAPRDPRRDRLAAGARRSRRRRRGGPRADPAAGRAALGRPRALTMIARRRKLDMVSALEAALESPQIGPEARERIQSFLQASTAPPRRRWRSCRADVFVRRLIERIGLRRHQLFAARRRPRSGCSASPASASCGGLDAARAALLDARLRPLPDAVADAGRARRDDDAGRPRPAAVLLADPSVKGLEFDHVYLLGLDRGALARRPSAPRVPDELRSRARRRTTARRDRAPRASPTSR